MESVKKTLSSSLSFLQFISFYPFPQWFSQQLLFLPLELSALVPLFPPGENFLFSLFPQGKLVLSFPLFPKGTVSNLFSFYSITNLPKGSVFFLHRKCSSFSLKGPYPSGFTFPMGKPIKPPPSNFFFFPRENVTKNFLSLLSGATFSFQTRKLVPRWTIFPNHQSGTIRSFFFSSPLGSKCLLKPVPGSMLVL